MNQRSFMNHGLCPIDHCFDEIGGMKRVEDGEF